MRTRYRRAAARVGVLIALLPSIVATAYTQSEPGSDEPASPFESTPGCVLPCWNDYVPGQTTVAEVDASILQLDEVGTTFTFERSYDSENGSTTYLWISPSPFNFGDSLIWAQEGVVDQIRVALDRAYSLGDVYATYGSPHFVYWQGYESAFGLELYYPELGLVFVVVVPNQLESEVDSIAFSYEWEGHTVWITPPVSSFADQLFPLSGVLDKDGSLTTRNAIEVLGYCIPPAPGDRFGHLNPYDDFSPMVDVTLRAVIQGGIRMCTIE